MLKVVERYTKGLDHAAFFIRRNVCDTLGVLASFIRRPGLPPPVEQLVGRSILNQCIRETDPRMKTTLAEASSNLILMMIATGRAETALRVFEQLNATFAALPADSPVRATDESLRQQFGTPEHAGEIMREIASCDPERLTRSVLPLVSILGDVLVPHVIEALASEEDRGKRGRFVRTLKTIGSPAFPFLINARSHPTPGSSSGTPSMCSPISAPPITSATSAPRCSTTIHAFVGQPFARSTGSAARRPRGC